MGLIDVAIYGGLGALALVSYGTALRYRVSNWRQYRDLRAHRTLIAAAAFLVVAIAGACAIASGIFALPVETRRVLNGIAWGAFAAAGLAFADASRPRDGNGR